jgi:predicted dehydrogenase
MTNRRAFLKNSSAGVVGTAALEWAGATLAAKRNETVVLGIIGCGGRGTYLARAFARLKGVEIAAVCDPDQARAGALAQVVAKAAGKAPKVVPDLRQVFDDKSIDAVTVATPDHWHAPAAILACDGGKHVYVEKPCAHNIREGQLLVEAARRSSRVVQHGTQSRSEPFVIHGIKLLREGLIGDVLVAKAINVQKRKDIGHAAPTEPPAGFDYDLWLGPAPYVHFQVNRYHYTWHWWYAFGTGDAGNDGIHEIDIARWGLGVEGHPSTVAALGGKYFFDDDQQFPDTQTVLFEYPGDGKVGSRRQLVFEQRLWSPYEPDGFDNGTVFYGTDGWMQLSKRGIFKVFDKQNKPLPLTGVPSTAETAAHQEDFLDAIRSGRKPNAEIAMGHVSATLCHLANIATRVGRTLRLDPSGERIIGDDEAARLVQRSYREGHWAVPRGA